MDLQLKGKVAMVGGASQGIGLAIARSLAQEGVQLALFARKAEKLEAAAQAIRNDFGVGVECVVGNVDQAQDNSRFVEQTVSRFGRLDILVNNDGAPPLGHSLAFDDEAWEKAVQQNLMSVVRLCRLSVPHMRTAGGGRIVHITATSVKQPMAGLSLSVATWAGVIAFTKSLVRDLGASNITVNTVCPGFIQTPRFELGSLRQAERHGRDVQAYVDEQILEIPIGRIGQPDDVASLVMFLVSGRSGFITGTTIQVDGGMTRSLI